MRILGILSVIAVVVTQSAAARAEEKAAPVFEKDVVPVLRAKCFGCHGAEKRKAKLDLRTKAGMLKGGETGPDLVPGAADKSELWRKINGGKMPPAGEEKLTDAEKALIRAWIDAGAKDSDATAQAVDIADKEVTDSDRDFWAFKKPVRPTVPLVGARERVRNPIDAFVLAALEKKGLTLSPEAGKLTLLRRAAFDLTGLPPTPGQIDEFLNDKSADAYEKLIDRLLASPRYGERWGRHWLDLAGYADSEGILDADYVRSAAWRYRD